METIFWHDYETFGANPKVDRPSQFAGVRTDTDLNIISEPITIYCKQSTDVLPHPWAVQVTGITPQEANLKGLSEYEFFKVINREFSEPNTCVVGFNNINFDDEVTRFGLYRNLFDPYAREWKNGNSRWDVIDLFRIVDVMFPGLITVPVDENGKKSFKLENLSKANGVIHENAHDAMSDVVATIELVKIIKVVEPKIYEFFFKNRKKNEVFNLLNSALVKKEPVLYVSSFFGGEKNYCAPILPIKAGSKYDKDLGVNDILAINLADENIKDWITLDIDTLKDRLFSKTDELNASNLTRPGIVKVTTNKCPFIAPISTITASDTRKNASGIDFDVVNSNMELLSSHQDKLSTLSAVYGGMEYDDEANVDLALYAGFPSNKERSDLDMIRDSQSFNIKTGNPKYDELVFRWKARNFDAYLSSSERDDWNKYCIHNINNNPYFSVQDFIDEINEVVDAHPESKGLMLSTAQYAYEITQDKDISILLKML